MVYNNIKNYKDKEMCYLEWQFFIKEIITEKSILVSILVNKLEYNTVKMKRERHTFQFNRNLHPMKS